MLLREFGTDAELGIHGTTMVVWKRLPAVEVAAETETQLLPLQLISSSCWTS